MAVTKMGFHGEIYYGASGSTAATKLTNSRDITFGIDREMGDTTIRGTGTYPPIGTESVVGLKVQIEWTMLEKSDDASLSALRAALIIGGPVALCLKKYSGATVFDGDVTLSEDYGIPLKGEQTLKYTATPTLDGGREPVLTA